MHEFHIVEKFVQEALQRAAKENKTSISEIHIGIPEASGLAPESIQLYFETIRADEPKLKAAQLHMRLVKTKLYCSACQQEFDRLEKSFSCPQCGSEGQMAKSSSQIMVEQVIFDASTASKPCPSGHGLDMPVNINPEQAPGFSPGRVERIDS